MPARVRLPSAATARLLSRLGLAAVLLWISGGPAFCQRPQVCGPGAKMTLKCVDACIICDIDGFTGTNDNGGRQDEGDLPKDFCTSVNHNIQWIGFMAGSRELTIDLSVTNCLKTTSDPARNFSFGLEAGVYEVLDCDYKRAVSKSNCNSNINDGHIAPLVMDDLVPGNFYYLVIDGNFADVCEYKVTVTRGTTEIPQVRNSGGLRGPTRMCNGPIPFKYEINAVPAATYYDWTLDGEPIGTEDDLVQMLTFAKDGEYELCVTASSICNAAPPECLKIKVGDYAPQRFTRTGCPGVPVVLEGDTITTSNTYTYTLTNRSGCDSTVIYDVTFGDPISATVDTTICTGTPTVINGQTITKSGDYSFATATKAGCDSVVTYRVTVTDVPRGRVDLALCGGSSVTVDGQTISASGTYEFPVVRPGACDSIVTYVVTVADTLRGSEAVSICSGASVTINSQTISAAGTYRFPLKTSEGCDSVATYVVTVTDTLRSTEAVSICSGASVTLNDQTISAAGTYRFPLKTRGGCDSVATYVVTLADTLQGSEAVSICSGSSVTVYGQTISAAGSYRFPLRTDGGCDSIVTYVVTVTDTLRGSGELTLCAGSSLEVYGQTINAAGAYSFPLKTSGGCDSVVTYVVTVADTLRGSGELTLCAGSSLEVYGQVITAAGAYSFPLKTSGGCDSIATYVVTLADTLQGSGELTLCAGSSLEVYGRTISAAGTYRFPLKTRGGCDSIATYVVTLTDTLRGSGAVTICSGSSVTVNGQTISAGGDYRFLLKTAGGCDSVVTYRVTVTPPLATAIDTVLCPGASATINERLITGAGTYTFPLRTPGGCDSIVTYRVSVGTPVVRQIETTVCAGEVVRFDGRDLGDAGVYRMTRGGASGCDSIIELTLKLKSCGFTATAEATPVSCAGGTDGAVRAYVRGLAPPYTLTYTKDGTSSRLRAIPVAADSTPTQLSELAAGTYVLTFTDRLGGAKRVTIEVESPSAVRAGTRRIADGSFDIRCAGLAEGRALALAGGGTPPYTFRWSDGDTNPRREGLTAQTLSVLVTDGNGCRDSASVTLVAPPKLELDVRVVDQGCDPTLEPGAVRVVNLAGGRSGYSLQVDGRPPGPPADRYTLAPGRHSVTLRDAADCLTDTSFVIDALEVPTAKTDSVWHITKGEEATLSVSTVGEIVSYAWSGPTELSCASCPAPTVSPGADATYTVLVTNEDGCQARTEALVLVLVDRKLWAPTAFSPNGDRVNDGFTVYVADEGSVIEELQVFDRWGEQLFVAEDIAPGDTAAGWDGTYRGEELNTAVFVYWARVRNSDGVTDVVQGEFTLMR